MCEILTNRDLIFIIVTICCALLELYLGKSDKVKSGSILELVYNLVVAIMRIKK